MGMYAAGAGARVLPWREAWRAFKWVTTVLASVVLPMDIVRYDVLLR
jgi:hypothetical protein